jgi:hypothetical protein
MISEHPLQVFKVQNSLHTRTGNSRYMVSQRGLISTAKNESIAGKVKIKRMAARA